MIVNRRCHIGWSTKAHEAQNGHFNGTEAATALRNWDELVDIAIPLTLNDDYNALA